MTFSEKEKLECEMSATNFLFVIIRDTELSKKINVESMKKKFLDNEISSNMLFDLAMREADETNKDIKKDIELYKHFAGTCEWKDDSK